MITNHVSALALPLAFRKNIGKKSYGTSSLSLVQCTYCLMKSLAVARTDWNSKRLITFKSKQNLYAVLGVNKDATTDDIKRAFLSRSKELHPDRNPSRKSHTEFVKLNEAYSTLKSSDSRNQYDILMGFNRSSQFHSSPYGSYSGGASKAYYESYNTSTGKKEWKWQEASQRTENHQRQNNLRSKDDIRKGNQVLIVVLFAVVLVYALIRSILIMKFHGRTMGGHNNASSVAQNRSSRFREIDYDRLMSIEQLREQDMKNSDTIPENQGPKRRRLRTEFASRDHKENSLNEKS
ncbi:dnaJ homolog subfamily C member 4-like isoform X2 [Symsagittifera roscoffensis]|uniref:dnaJ homolog subfamily C member 4-like isoform X2 n=1 Tax=Symsagittifera roscoffensis TaxID=84072 RepID=UPI00307B3A30